MIIAHRGASGYLPEHTLVSKALAFGMGADYLEQDVVATRDGELIVFHDITLEQITDVRERFPTRSRDDGHYYCIDFTLDEIRQLRVGPRRTDRGGLRHPGRFGAHGGTFPVSTFDEEVRFIQELNRTTNRRVGIYPEIKEPEWHHQHGIDLGRKLLDALNAQGYQRRDQAVFVQCFDPAELRRLRADLGCGLQLVQLLDSSQAPPDCVALKQIAGYADAIGPAVGLIYMGVHPPGQSQPKCSDLVQRAHGAGLRVHPYTFRRDEIPAGIGGFEALLDLFLGTLAVDGIFTDHPDVAHCHLTRLRHNAAAG